MGSVKPWQIVVMVLAFGAVIASVFYSCSGGSDAVSQADTVRMVDVESGELYQAPFPDRAPVTFPAKSPASGNQTLFPVRDAGDGKWALDTRYLPKIKAVKGLKQGLIVDQRTGEIAPASADIKKVDIFGK